MKLFPVPMTLKEANDFVHAYHRHSKRTVRDGGRFAIGVSDGNGLIGVAIVGNPISATYMDGLTAEVTRTCTSPGAQKGAVSFLYGACWRACRAMGYRRLITYTLKSESGASLRGAGWRILHETKNGHDDWAAKARMTGKARQWQDVYGQQKICWIVDAEQGDRA